MGVIAYFLLAGYTPFDRENQQQEMEAIIAGDYKFEPGALYEFIVRPTSPMPNRGVLGKRVQYCERLRQRMPDDRPYPAPDCGRDAATPVARRRKAALRPRSRKPNWWSYGPAPAHPETFGR